jgi:hypothetical protein
VTIARVRILVCHSATVGARGTEEGPSAEAALTGEFPTVAIEVEPYGEQASTPLSTIDVARWTDRRNDFAPFDAHIDDLARRGPVTIVLRGQRGACIRAAHEMLTRWQRLLDRRNVASRTPEFDRLLARFRAMHDLQKPLVCADYHHALDAWQWLLRLLPEASGAVQLAALLHDVERLESEPDARVEHLATDYVAFKNAHARRGAAIARRVLAECGLDRAACEHAAELVEHHERPAGESNRAFLADADALSFFSQNSSGYVDYFGADQARRKIAYTLGRMREGARARLATIRMREDVARLLAEVQRNLRETDPRAGAPVSA